PSRRPAPRTVGGGLPDPGTEWQTYGADRAGWLRASSGRSCCFQLSGADAARRTSDPATVVAVLAIWRRPSRPSPNRKSLNTPDRIDRSNEQDPREKWSAATAPATRPALSSELRCPALELGPQPQLHAAAT